MNKIHRKGRKEGRKDSFSEYQGFNQPQFKYNQIQKQPFRLGEEEKGRRMVTTRFLLSKASG